MTIAQSFIAELQHEAVSTKKLFERIPFDKADYKPHEKNMPLRNLASHIAEMPLWLVETINTDGMNMADFDYKPYEPKNNEELLKYFEDGLKKAEELLNKTTDDELMKIWTMKTGDTIIFSMPKVSVIRGMILNHLYHHRGQLTVYLRMLDVSLPGTYGPTADEQ